MRILGISLLVALVVGAVGAGSAQAMKFTFNTWTQYKGCPSEANITDCFYGRTNGGAEGGEFKYGHVNVKLNKPVVIQGGFRGSGQTVEVEPATNGFSTLESGKETIVGGLKAITPKIQEEAEWPQSLKESFEAAKKNKETNKATVKIEMAGNECFEVPGCLSTENLIFEEGTAFRLSLKTTVENAWVAKLSAESGGGPCTIGSDENPIKQNLTSAGAGRAGELHFNEAFTNIEVHGSELLDVAWHIPAASGAKGCGGPTNETYIDHALNIALEVEVPSQVTKFVCDEEVYNEEFEEYECVKGHPVTETVYHEVTGRVGNTWLTGNLFDGSAAVVQKMKEKGEI